MKLKVILRIERRWKQLNLLLMPSFPTGSKTMIISGHIIAHHFIQLQRVSSLVSCSTLKPVTYGAMHWASYCLLVSRYICTASLVMTWRLEIKSSLQSTSSLCGHALDFHQRTTVSLAIPKSVHACVESKFIACVSRYLTKYFRFDYCGISILITGSFIPWVFYGFLEDHVSRWVYVVIVTSVGVSVSIFSLSDKFGSSEYRHIRAIVFIVFGIATALPFIHFFFFSKDHIPVSLVPLLTFGFCYIFGASLYACRIPERYFPGKCDLFFQSHQIFHCFVVLAAYIHYLNIQEVAFIRKYRTWKSLLECPISFIWKVYILRRRLLFTKYLI